MRSGPKLKNIVYDKLCEGIEVQMVGLVVKSIVEDMILFCFAPIFYK